MASNLKKESKVKLYALVIDIDVINGRKKDIRGGICHASHGYVKVNIKYMKDYDKNKESTRLKYWDVNNLYS